MRRVRASLILLLLLGAGTLTAQEEPVWLQIERAERLIDAGEFGLAIQAFRRALQLSPDDPRAYYGLGIAYKAIGDFTVATEYLTFALEHRADFPVPSEALLVRYERAEIFRNRLDLQRYEAELLQIIAEDPPPPEAILPDEPAQMIATDGLDRFLVLFRFAESGSTRARGMLAELLVGLGRYAAAAEQAAFAVLQQLTTIIDGVIDRDPTYEFRTIDELLSRAERFPETRDYLEEALLFHDLYYLAAAYLGDGKTSAAVGIWTTVERHGAPWASGSEWAGRASRQIAAPRVEPLLVPPR